MSKRIKLIYKYTFLFLLGGIAYHTIEIVYRLYSHWSMFILGGICFVSCGLINEIVSWEFPLVKQMLIGTAIITILEFITGCIVNLWLGLDVWDYSNLSFNILGQVSLVFSLIWFFLSGVCIVLDDYLRWLLFNEEKPHYRII